MTAFEWFPAIIESIGGKIDADELGLGISLFGTNKTLLEEYGTDKLNEELNKNSDEYDQLLF